MDERLEKLQPYPNKVPLILMEVWEQFGWDERDKSFVRSKRIGYTMILATDEKRTIYRNANVSQRVLSYAADTPWIMPSDERWIPLRERYIVNSNEYIITKSRPELMTENKDG